VDPQKLSHLRVAVQQRRMMGQTVQVSQDLERYAGAEAAGARLPAEDLGCGGLQKAGVL
jgi:hypothetical protein